MQLSLGASETYTDNLTLAPDERAISDYITEISPRLDACADAGRIRGSLSYQLQGLFYASNSEYNDVYNSVAGDTTVVLVPGRLYLGADTTYGQTVVDPSIGYSRSNLLRPGNQTSAWTTNISPYFVQPVGFLGTATLRYRYGKTIYGDSDIPDSTVHGGYFNLVSPAEYDTWSWEANAFTQRVRRSGGDRESFFEGLSDTPGQEQGPQPNPFPIDDNLQDADDPRVTYFDKATLQLGYQLTQSLKLLALGGLEDEYKPDGTNDRLGSPLWNVGFLWTSTTNTLEARVGHRFFGTSYFVQATHRGSAFDASVEYSEEPSTQGLNGLNGNGVASSTSFRRPTTSLFDRGVFVSKRLSASLKLDTSALTETRLTAYRQTREYIEIDSGGEEFTGADIELEYRFTPRMALLPRAGWEHRERDRGSQSDTSEASISLVRTLSPSARAGISYGHAWRDTENGGSDYDENRVSISVLKSF